MYVCQPTPTKIINYSAGIVPFVTELYTDSQLYNLPLLYSPHCSIQTKRDIFFAALRYSNGTSILNGEWKFSGSNRVVEGAGTKFNYRKQDGTSLETVTSPGPLALPVEIMVCTSSFYEGVNLYFKTLERISKRETTSQKYNRRASTEQE